VQVPCCIMHVLLTQTSIELCGARLGHGHRWYCAFSAQLDIAVKGWLRCCGCCSCCGCAGSLYIDLQGSGRSDCSCHLFCVEGRGWDSCDTERKQGSKWHSPAAERQWMGGPSQLLAMAQVESMTTGADFFPGSVWLAKTER